MNQPTCPKCGHSLLKLGDIPRIVNGKPDLEGRPKFWLYGCSACDFTVEVPGEIETLELIEFQLPISDEEFNRILGEEALKLPDDTPDMVIRTGGIEGLGAQSEYASKEFDALNKLMEEMYNSPFGYHYMLIDGEVVRAESMEQFIEWQITYYSQPDRAIARTYIGEVKVSTVFLFIDHGWPRSGTEPTVFETMIFGGKYDEKTWRYTSLEAAMQGHERAVGIVRGEVTPDEAE
jgi:hypothetical protein